MIRTGKSDRGTRIVQQKTSQIFESPQCLIETDKDGKLTVNHEVLSQLRTLDRKLVVVAIAGMYRTGKSYLMNRLAGTSIGFALGATIQSKTKGIWIWVRPHPIQMGAYLVLMDTEGLGDIEKGDMNHDNWIFTLATLLSSTLVYNFLGAANNDMITKLHFVSEISQRIKAREADEAGSDHDFDMHFPLFIIALRDFCLDLEIDGQNVTADEYLEHFLILEKNKSPEFIESRRSIRKYFKTRKCFTFDRPASTKKLKKLEQVCEDDLCEEFIEDSNRFCDFIYKECPHLKLPDGNKVTGSMFATLIETYVAAIREGVVPCVENAFTMMANQENRKAIEGALKLYKELLTGKIHMPTETEEELSRANQLCQKEAIAHFTSRAIRDFEGSFQKTLAEEMLMTFLSYDKENRRVSQERCHGILAKLEAVIKGKLENKVYTQSGGFREYTEDMNALIERYNKQRGLGLEKKRVLDDYITSSANTSASILAADERMTEEEKKIQEMKQETYRLESERKRDEEEIQHLKQLAEDNMAAMEETRNKMEMKYQEDMKELHRQQEEMHEKRMQEQQRLMEEGFKREAEQLERERARSQREFTEEKNRQEELRRLEKERYEEMMNAKLEMERQKHEYEYKLQQRESQNREYEQTIRRIEEERQSNENLQREMEEMAQRKLSEADKRYKEDMEEKIARHKVDSQRDMDKLNRDIQRSHETAQNLRTEMDKEKQGGLFSWLKGTAVRVKDTAVDGVMTVKRALLG